MSPLSRKNLKRYAKEQREPEETPETTRENLFETREPFYLKIMDRFRGVLTRQGIDYDQFRLLIRVKMAVNQRRLAQGVLQQGFQERAGKQKKSPSTIIMIIFQVIMGAVSSVFLFAPYPVMLRYTMTYTLLLLFMTLGLISQLAQILLSPEDLLVLPVRPIDPKALNLSRVVQVMIYQFTDFLSYTTPLMIMGFIALGPAGGLVGLVTNLCFAAFVLLLSLSLFLVAARHFSGQKLRDVIAYLQIFMLVVMTMGYQMLGVIMDSTSTWAGLQEVPAWFLCIPSAWFGAPADLATQGFRVIPLVGTLLMILALAGLTIYYFKFSDTLEARLLQLAADKGDTLVPRTKLREFFARLVCRDELERSYFRFAWQMLKNERNFKVQVYPSLAIYSLMPYILMLQSLGGSDSEEMFAMPGYLMLYMMILMVPLMLISVVFSDYYEAAWIFRIVPCQSDAAMARATAKVIWLRLFLPLLLLHLILMIMTWGLQGVITVLNLMAITFIFLMISIMTIKMVRPFSKQRVTEPGNGCGSTLVIAVLALVLGAVQFTAFVFLPVLSWVWTGLLVLIALFLMFVYRGGRKAFSLPKES